jgi:tetratricopeptide (TPR) repeat protein
MKRQLVARLLRMNVHMGRVSEGVEDSRVIDLSLLADALDRDGETDEALALSREAFSLIPKLRPLIASKAPRKRKKHADDVAAALKRHAERLHAAGWLDDATTARREAVALHVEALDTTERYILGGDFWERAEEELAAGRVQKAITAAEAALQVWSRIREEERDGVLGVGSSLNLLSRCLAAAGRRDEARDAAEQAIAIFSANGGGPDLVEAEALLAAATSS